MTETQLRQSVLEAARNCIASDANIDEERISVIARMVGVANATSTVIDYDAVAKSFDALGWLKSLKSARPSIGDFVFYKDQVCIVEAIDVATFVVIAINDDGEVSRKRIRHGSQNVKYYGMPDYANQATEEDVINDSGILQIGDVVQFVGNRCYGTTLNGENSVICNPGLARVTSIKEIGSRRYHLVAVGQSYASVNGWVETKCIAGLTETEDGKEIIVGTKIKFKGKMYYTSQHKGARSVACKGGTAIVEDIKTNCLHPYKLKHESKACTVDGWVDASSVYR